MTRLPTPEAIAAWLPSQRWFGAKSRGIARVSFADAIPLGPATVLLADVELDGGGSERYAVPLLAGERIADAVGAVEFCRAAVALLACAGAVPGDHGEIRAVPAPALAERWPAGPPADLSVRRLGGEQSNTSVALGDAFVLKQFRKLAEGVNPEAEVTRFLTERTEFRNTPRLAGHLEYRDATGATTTLAVMQALVLDAADGWQWVLARLREPDGAPVTTQALRRLGERTGELHRTLASDSRDPAFAPEPITDADVVAWSEAVDRQLASARAAVPGADARADADALRAALAPLIGRQKIRHHGDFHLGQTLYRPTTGDWSIIDFEGEPLRPLVERRRKHTPLRDVAGLLRSIDYAAASASGASAALGEWAAQAATAFIEGYRATTDGAAFAPESDAPFREAVAVFELEKAAYEIVYEANNRPAWIAIPTRGLVTATATLWRWRT